MYFQVTQYGMKSKDIVHTTCVFRAQWYYSFSWSLQSSSATALSREVSQMSVLLLTRLDKLNDGSADWEGVMVVAVAVAHRAGGAGPRTTVVICIG